MDRSKIKSFAVWARRALTTAISERAKGIGITEDNMEGKDWGEEIEEIAYTWFKRFIALRYMEVNDYLPSGIRVLSSQSADKSEPDIMTRVTEVIEELKLNLQYVHLLLDRGTSEAREELYKYILVRQCNELEKIFPKMFGNTSDCIGTLLPDNLLGEDSVIRKMITDIEEEEWREEVEIIGWMYQYYFSEKKDEVFEALKNNVKITKENIPAATQLFTPKWIVKYMVENSLGRLWLDRLKVNSRGTIGNKQCITNYSELKEIWRYYLDEAEQEPKVEEELRKVSEVYNKLTPEDIKVLDPCMGSGHILAYAFDVLYEIYRSEGYPNIEIPGLILRKNLYGLDVDDRVAQLAYFELIMKARHYNTRLFEEIEEKQIKLNLYSIKDSNDISGDIIEYFYGLKEEVEYLINVFKDAKEYGSILKVRKINFDAIEKRLEEIRNDKTISMFDPQHRHIILDKIPALIRQARIMSEKYEICVTNPPYIGNKGINDKLKAYIAEKFHAVRSDIFSVFIERNYDYTTTYGHLGFMTPFVWMFISSYEELRKNMINHKSITSLIQLEYSGFADATVPVCTFTLRNSNTGETGEYIRLSDFKGAENQPIKVLEAIQNPKVDYRYTVKTKDFSKIPGCTIAYWISDKIRNTFSREKLEKYVNACTGMQTGNNEKFTRYWYEVEINKTNIFSENSNCKWHKYNEGGNLRKWYGNHLNLLNWENNGRAVRSNKGSVIRNKEFYYMEGITWKRIGSAGIGLRYMPPNFIFDQSGDSMFPKDIKYLKYFLGYLNSKVAEVFFKVLAPTLNLTAGNINYFPIVFPKDNAVKEKIDALVSECIDVCKCEWDSFEISWDFKKHPLLPVNNYKHLSSGEKDKKNLSAIHSQVSSITRISEVFDDWELLTDRQFQKLKHDEEILNRIFLDIFGLQDEITPEVEDKDITIAKADRERDIKSLISYAVGCILGRYSIYEEGLIYTGRKVKSGVGLEDNREEKKNDSILCLGHDNIIPITDEEYFEDDMASRFIEFIKITYGEETLEENLDYISDSIGRKPSETSRQAIRKYFLRDFYNYHTRIYQRRPIYWLFDSGKNDGFKALIYMHKYDEDTVAKVRTGYLLPLLGKYEDEIFRLQRILASEECAAEARITSKKKLDKISKQLEECKEYDKVMAHFAKERISIDLDDGVKANYEKVMAVLNRTK